MSEHTQGRLWLNTEGSAIVHGEDGRIACPPNHSQRWAWKENARRLVACWNACEGVGTQTLEQHPAPFSALRAERDELLEALREVSDVFGVDWREGSTQRRLGDLARAAIAKATGGQT